MTLIYKSKFVFWFFCGVLIRGTPLPWWMNLKNEGEGDVGDEMGARVRRQLSGFGDYEDR